MLDSADGYALTTQNRTAYRLDDILGYGLDFRLLGQIHSFEPVTRILGRRLEGGCDLKS